MKLLDYLAGKNKSVTEYIAEKNESITPESLIPEELYKCDCCDNHKKLCLITDKNKNHWENIQKLITSENNHMEFLNFLECQCPCKDITIMWCKRILSIKIERQEVRESESESLGSESERSEESDSAGSLKDFIVEDSGLSSRERRKLDKVLKKNKKW